MPGLFRRVRTTFAIAATLAAGLTCSAHAQTQSRPAFDIKRMADSEGLFQTFTVTETQKLQAALARGTVRPDTRLLVTDTATGRLALVTDQMSFHHIAQGVAAGKPWMVTF